MRRTLQQGAGGLGRDAPFREWGGLSDDQILALLAPHAEAIRSAEHAVVQHVAVLRERGLSWARIGGALGISKQAAWERFSGE